MLPDEEQARSKIQVTLREPIEEMRRILTLALSIVPGGGSWRITRTTDIDFAVYTVTLALFTKALKTFRAIQVVAESGLGQDATALLRVLFETTIAVLFTLQRNSRLRARLFVVHAQSKRLQALRTWKQTKGFKRKATKKKLKNATQPLRDAVTYLAEINRWPKKHPYGNALQTAITQLNAARRARHGIPAAEQAAVEAVFRATKDHWSGRNIEAAAKTVGWHSTYQTFYRYASPFSHAGDVEQHLLRGKREGSVVMKIIPGADAELVRTMETASLMLWAIASRINKRFGLGHDSAFDTEKPSMVIRREQTAIRRQGGKA